jgi:hypothetical protein
LCVAGDQIHIRRALRRAKDTGTRS